MNCLKCGVEMALPRDVPLCEDCERKQQKTSVKMSDPSEILEYHINSQKEHGNLPKDFRLTDVGREVAKKMIYKLLKNGDSGEIITIAIFGFCYGYLCHEKEQERKSTSS